MILKNHPEKHASRHFFPKPIDFYRKLNYNQNQFRNAYAKESAMRESSIHTMCSMEMYMCPMCMFCDADFQCAF